MTTEKHDPWALLREARNIIDYRDCDCGNEECERLGVFVRRIDAALAAVPPFTPVPHWPWKWERRIADVARRNNAPPGTEIVDLVERLERERDEARAALADRAEGSTEDVVEWASMNMRLIEDPKLTVSHAQIEDRHLKVWGYSDEWYWSVEAYRKIRGVADTLADAKCAAIAAARGMR